MQVELVVQGTCCHDLSLADPSLRRLPWCHVPPSFGLERLIPTAGRKQLPCRGRPLRTHPKKERIIRLDVREFGRRRGIALGKRLLASIAVERSKNENG
jgi:hypothetical protein